MKKFLFTLFFLLSSLTAGLEAGWNTSENIHIFEDTSWREVSYQGSHLSFTSMLPNYDPSSVDNNFESYVGGSKVDNKFGLINEKIFLIQMAPKSMKMKSGKEFKKAVMSSFNMFAKTSGFSWLDAKKYGAKYAVEFLATTGNKLSYWRVFTKNNRNVALCTMDENEANRTYFFENFHITK